jgi:hypothetical protein
LRLLFINNLNILNIIYSTKYALKFSYNVSVAIYSSNSTVPDEKYTSFIIILSVEFIGLIILIVSVPLYVKFGSLLNPKVT